MRRDCGGYHAAWPWSPPTTVVVAAPGAADSPPTDALVPDRDCYLGRAPERLDTSERTSREAVVRPAGGVVQSKFVHGSPSIRHADEPALGQRFVP